MSMIDLKKLVEAGVHFGHHSSKWHPKMKPYIWGTRNKVHLINVAKTAFLMERAEKFLETAAAEGKQVLWVGTKKTAQPLIRAIAAKLGQPYVSHRWIGGTLSNFEQVKKAITRLLHFRDILDKGTVRATKKEQSMMVKEIERLEKNIGGITKMNGLPAAIIVVDGKKEHAVIREAANVGIPVIGLIDTNTDPSGVSYLIPSNDDSPKAIEVIFDYLGEGVARGMATAAAAAAVIAEKAAAEKAARKKLADEKKAADDQRAAEQRAAAKKDAAEKAAKAAPVKKEVAKVEATPVAVVAVEQSAAPVKPKAEKAPKAADSSESKAAPKATAKPAAEKKAAKPAVAKAKPKKEAA